MQNIIITSNFTSDILSLNKNKCPDTFEDFIQYIITWVSLNINQPIVKENIRIIDVNTSLCINNLNDLLIAIQKMTNLNTYNYYLKIVIVPVAK
jgi:hypothetical protein